MRPHCSIIALTIAILAQLSIGIYLCVRGNCYINAAKTNGQCDGNTCDLTNCNLVGNILIFVGVGLSLTTAISIFACVSIARRFTQDTNEALLLNSTVEQYLAYRTTNV